MRRGVPAKFETDFDEKLLEEVREELLREKEKGGPKVYRKGTTVPSVYAYAYGCPYITYITHIKRL